MSTIFSAPINPERPRGEPSCAKCAHLRTSHEHGRPPVPWCAIDILRSLTPCTDFRDASVERTVRRGLKPGYDVVRAA